MDKKLKEWMCISVVVYLDMMYVQLVYFLILHRLGAKSLSKKAHDKRTTKSNPAVDLKADDKASSLSESPSSGSKSTAVYATDHKGTTSSPSTTTYTDDKYNRK